MKKKKCQCEPECATYVDMGTLKCQHCMGIVEGERLEKFNEYNKTITNIPAECQI